MLKKHVPSFTPSSSAALLGQANRERIEALTVAIVDGVTGQVAVDEFSALLRHDRHRVDVAGVVRGIGIMGKIVPAGRILEALQGISVVETDIGPCRRCSDGE